MELKDQLQQFRDPQGALDPRLQKPRLLLREVHRGPSDLEFGLPLLPQAAPVEDDGRTVEEVLHPVHEPVVVQDVDVDQQEVAEVVVERPELVVPRTGAHAEHDLKVVRGP